MIITEKMLIRIEGRRLAMKRQGKISPNIRNETKKNNYPDLPRASGNQERIVSCAVTRRTIVSAIARVISIPA